MKRFFTDDGTGLTAEQSAELGLIHIPHNLSYKDEPIQEETGVALEQEYLKIAAPNAQDYKAVFDRYLGDELVYVTWSQKSKLTQTWEQIRQLGIPNLTIIDSGFFGEAQIEVTKRIMQGLPYDDIKHFFVVKNTKTGWIPCVPDKYCLFTTDDGQFKLIATYDTRFLALAKLRTFVNTKLYHGDDVNNSMALHCGRDYVGGMWLGQK